MYEIDKTVSTLDIAAEGLSETLYMMHLEWCLVLSMHATMLTVMIFLILDVEKSLLFFVFRSPLFLGRASLPVASSGLHSRLFQFLLLGACHTLLMLLCFG